MLRHVLTASLLSAAAAAQAPAPPQPVAPTFRVTFIEVAPAEVRNTITILKTYRQVVQRAPGFTSVEVLQQVGRPNLFAIEEKWKDNASLQAHVASPDMKKFKDDIQRALISPLDERLLSQITSQPATGNVSDQTVYVLTHADATARREEIPGILQELATGARRENGNVLFDVTVQPNRTNHFTLFEVWADQKAYEAHVVSDNTRKFRATFAPISGALYDERLYKSIL